MFDGRCTMFDLRWLETCPYGLGPNVLGTNDPSPKQSATREPLLTAGVTNGRIEKNIFSHAANHEKIPKHIERLKILGKTVRAMPLFSVDGYDTSKLNDIAERGDKALQKVVKFTMVTAVLNLIINKSKRTSPPKSLMHTAGITCPNRSGTFAGLWAHHRRPHGNSGTHWKSSGGPGGRGPPAGTHSGIQRTPIENLPIENLSNLLPTKHLSKTYRRSIELPSDENLPNTYRKSNENRSCFRPTNIYRTSIEHLSKISLYIHKYTYI